MKNAIFIAALVVALIAVFAAPAHSDGLILRGGMNFAGADTDPGLDEGDKEYKPGANAALLAEMGTGAFRLLAGAGYENRGQRWSGSDNNQVRLDYVSIPVMLSVGNVSNGGWVPRLFLNFGVEPAFLVSSEVEMGPFSVEPDPEKFDFGLRGEAGLEIPFSSSGAVILGGGYSRSLTDAAKGDDLDWFNQTIHIFGGLKFGMM